MAKKRKHKRVTIGIRVAGKDTRIIGLTRNLSAGGCFIEKSVDCNLLPIGKTLPFFLEIPGDYAYIEIDGVVKHHGRGEDGMGICFDTTNRGIQSLIDQFLDNYH